MAIAVLSIWFLSLLAPMHQTSRLIGELSEAGIFTVSNWSLCLDRGGDGPGGAVDPCPAQGIGKSDLLVPVPLTLLATAFPVFAFAGWDQTPERFRQRIRSRPGQARAPPLQQ